MPELGPYGSVRGARGNSRPYRDPRSKADVTLLNFDVRFTPNSGHPSTQSKCPLWANSGHSALQQKLALFDHIVGDGEQA